MGEFCFSKRDDKQLFYWFTPRGLLIIFCSSPIALIRGWRCQWGLDSNSRTIWILPGTASADFQRSPNENTVLDACQ
jgi:hypothetical protein